MSDPADKVLEHALRETFGGRAGDDLTWRVLARWQRGDSGDAPNQRAGRKRWPWLLPLVAAGIAAVAWPWLRDSLQPTGPRVLRGDVEVVRPGRWDPESRSPVAGETVVATSGATLRVEPELDATLEPRSLATLGASFRVHYGSVLIEHRGRGTRQILTALGPVSLRGPGRLAVLVSVDPFAGVAMNPPFQNLARNLHVGSAPVALVLSLTLVAGSATFDDGAAVTELSPDVTRSYSWLHQPDAPTQSGARLVQDKKREIRVIPQVAERVGTRLFLLYGDLQPYPGSSPGQVCIQYGQPLWKSEYEDRLLEMGADTRVRFGKDFWTSLDSFFDLHIGGVEVPAGYYYLGLVGDGDGGLELELFDPAVIRKAGVDAVGTEHLKQGGIRVPLEVDITERHVQQLSIELKAGQRTDRGTLEILWGPAKLTTTVALDLAARTPAPKKK